MRTFPRMGAMKFCHPYTFCGDRKTIKIRDKYLTFDSKLKRVGFHDLILSDEYLLQNIPMNLVHISYSFDGRVRPDFKYFSHNI